MAGLLRSAHLLDVVRHFMLFMAADGQMVKSVCRYQQYRAVNASASPWVHWEYDTARQAKGLAAVIPMPLEDPKIAPPPPEFADAHMRDRFMVARYGLARIDEIAAGGRSR